MELAVGLGSGLTMVTEVSTELAAGLGKQEHSALQCREVQHLRMELLHHRSHLHHDSPGNRLQLSH